MDRLHFSKRAQRRARRKRVLGWLAVASIVGSLAGIPAPSFALDAVQEMFLRNEQPDSVRTSASAESALRFRTQVFEFRPDPTPSASPSATATDSITETIYAAASEFGIDGSYLLSVADCESGLNPNAYNAAGYHGLFQFDFSTWSAYGYGSIYDPVAQARTAARLLAAGQSSRWPICS